MSRERNRQTESARPKSPVPILVLHVCAPPGGFSRCNLTTARWWSVDSASIYIDGTNIQHWAEQISWNDTEINKWALTQTFSEICVVKKIYVLDKSVHGEQYYVTAQSLQDSFDIIYVRITMLADHTAP